jgi:N-acetylglucosaminyl-diphospho-decaprenol L-rhamnosyltransferase
MTLLTLAAGIVLYKNDLELLRKALAGFKHQTFESLDVEIKLGFIDNTEGSQLEQVKAIAQALEMKVEVAIASKNIGFGAGHNRLFQSFECSPDYYLCVNPDGLPHHRLVERLLRFAQAKADQGIFEARQFPTEHPKVYDLQSLKTDWCSGCCLLIPRTVYKETGGFDEDFFLYCEDVDLSWRVQLAGYQCFTVSDALFHHYVYSVERDLSNQQKQMAISMYKLAVKYGHESSIKTRFSVLKQVLTKKELEEVRAFQPEKAPPVPLPEFIKFDRAASYAEARW